MITPTDHRFALLTFIAGSGLGYYPGVLNLLHTSVLAYGMAAVAFWRAGLMLKIMGIDLDY
jgi:hypothetical protein